MVLCAAILVTVLAAIFTPIFAPVFTTILASIFPAVFAPVLMTRRLVRLAGHGGRGEQCAGHEECTKQL
jgi:hypothetical protein